MAGKPFTAEMTHFVHTQKLQSRVVSLESVENEALRALYSLASLFLFPSLEEGFGWPIVEAQACGCPVLTTRQAPMTEVGGEAAFYFDPRDLESATRHLIAALDEDEKSRSRRIASGLANAARFSSAAMVDRYCEIYRELIEAGVKPRADDRASNLCRTTPGPLSRSCSLTAPGPHA